jgi:phosphoglycerate dehydrogenase-like enzyme
VDVAAVQARNVTFCGTGGIATATSELTWALILALSRGIPTAAQSMSQGDWQPTPGTDLHGATLGLMGLGRLGAQVGTVARAFGMSVIAWSPRLTEERASEHGAELVPKSQLFRRSDVVSVHMVLAPSTRGLIGAEELRAMKPTAFLVNTSRGPLVDESALLTALHEGWIAGAGIDVYDREPLPPDHPLRDAPRTLLTPHLGYVTDGTMQRFYSQAAEDVRAFLDGAPIRLVERKP